jgi:ComF family protein
MDAALLEPRTRLGRLAWRLLPGFCVLCRQRSHLPLDLCAECLAALPWAGRVCVQCALPLAGAPGDRCARCVARAPPWTRAVATLRYRGAAADLVRSLKFDGNAVSGRVLGTLIGAAVRDAYADRALPDIVVPVPLSLRRLLVRGQNQAGVLARHAARLLDLPVDWAGCRRVRHTAPQSGRSRRDRLRNPTGAFACATGYAGRIVAVVDDVMTTGATLGAVARCLRRSGAAEVHVWVGARTDPPTFR